MEGKTIEILMSCMHQSDCSIVQRSNVQTNIVVVNQCDKDAEETLDFQNAEGETCEVRFICTTSRGLSRSRNMAINNSTADICVISDDDELFGKDFNSTIKQSFDENPEMDILVFQVANSGKTFAPKPYRIGYLKALKVASWQIAFRRKSVTDKGIWFDEEMGSGTGHGPCEEIKFIYDCLKKGLKIRYIPRQIASLDPTSESQWFHGYTPKYFFNHGWSLRRFMGRFFSFLYICTFVVRKTNEYGKDMPMWRAFYYMQKGASFKEYPKTSFKS